METIGVIPGTSCLIDIAYVPSEDMLYSVDLVDNNVWRIDPSECPPPNWLEQPVLIPTMLKVWTTMKKTASFTGLHTTPVLIYVLSTLETGASVSIGTFPNGT